jgi:hypothetical protein
VYVPVLIRVKAKPFVSDVGTWNTALFLCTFAVSSGLPVALKCPDSVLYAAILQPLQSDIVTVTVVVPAAEAGATPSGAAIAAAAAPRTSVRVVFMT